MWPVECCQAYRSRPRQVRQAKQARVECDVSACYGPQFVPTLGGVPTSAFVAEGSAVAVYEGERVG